MALVVRGAGFLVNAFYRRLALGGAVPQQGPVLVVANHTHQLVDVALALQAIERPAVLLAKATLFHAPILSWFVKRTHALPVHRARDGARDASAKRETTRSLAAMEQEVAAGGCALVFPEGVSHEEPGIYRAHSGAARVALAAVRRGARDLRIVPLGLLYRAKRRPRSEAATLVGAPVRWDDLVIVAHEHKHERDGDCPDPSNDHAIVDALTARIEDALRDVTLHLEAWEDLPLVQAATLLEAELAARGEDDESQSQSVLTALSEGIARMRAHAPAQLAQVRRRVDMHARRMQRIGVRPDESADAAVRRAVVAAGRMLAGLAIAPFIALAGLLTRRRERIDRAASLLRNAVDVVRLVLAGRFTKRVDVERRALLAEIDALLRASRALPPHVRPSQRRARSLNASGDAAIAHSSGELTLTLASDQSMNAPMRASAARSSSMRK